MKRTLVLSAAVLAATASAQSPLDAYTINTPPTNNNAGSGATVYADLAVNQAVRITQIDVDTGVGAGTPVNFELHTCATTYVGNDGNPGAWTLAASGSGTASALGTPTVINLTTPLILTPGTYGLAFYGTDFAVHYTTGPANPTVSNNELTLTMGGSVLGAPGTAITFSPREIATLIHYTGANGLFPAFSADVESGPSPLTVNFTDQSFTSDPGGILAWDWDFDGDGNSDSTLQAPAPFTYANCGSYDVSLTCVDALAVATETKTGFITADPIDGSFTVSNATPNTGEAVQFSFSGTPGSTLLWDLDGDGAVDTTDPNTGWIYTSGGLVTVSLTTLNACQQVVETADLNVQVPPPAYVDSQYPAGANWGWYTTPAVSFVDLAVAQNTAIEAVWHSTTLAGIHDFEIYTQSGSLAAGTAQTGFANWTLQDTVTGINMGGDPFTRERVLLNTPIALTPGDTAIAIVTTSGNHNYWNIPAGNPIAGVPAGYITATPFGYINNFPTATTFFTDFSWAGIIEFTGPPAVGLRPDFAATYESGASPLSTQFFDLSKTDDPNGILARDWDLDGDGNSDSTVQNPAFVYTTCGSFDVTLTVTDGTNGSLAVTKTNYIVTDAVAASFSNPTLAGVGQSVTFFEAATAGSTLSWDFDGDGNQDATGSNPTFIYTTAGQYTPTLTATLGCNSVTVSGNVIDVVAGAIFAPTSGSFQFFQSPPDATYIDVQNTGTSPALITAIYHRSGLANTAHDLEVWTQSMTTLGNEGPLSNWTLAATGTAVSPNNQLELFRVQLGSALLLPPGLTGIAVVSRTGGHAWDLGTAGQTYSGQGLNITNQGSYTTFATTGQNQNYGWAGGMEVANNLPGGTILQFGAGCTAAGNPVHDLLFPATPAVGGPFPVRITNVGALASLHGGTSNTFNAKYGLPLPADFNALAGLVAGCTFFVSSDVELPFLPADIFGNVDVPFAVPNNPAFAGLVFYTQAVCINPGSAGVPVQFSNAYLGVVQ